MKVRLSDDEAKLLGLVPKKKGIDGNPRYRLSPGQQQELKEIRNKGIVDHCIARGIDFKSVSTYWDKTKEFSVMVRPEVVAMRDICAELIDEMESHAPNYEYIKRDHVTDPHCLVVDPADVHIGKLASSFETGEEYNTEIAVQRVREGVEGILAKATGFNIDKIVLVIGNDILHIDSPKRTTTSGTPQDTDGMWYDNFLKAKQIYVDVIERLMMVADVHVMYNPSNHDYTHGFFLADVIKTWFKDSKNVTFDTSISHRKYVKYGANLIGSTHGDGAKESNLPLLMANEAPMYWADTKYRYFYTHHVHHKSSKEYPGVTVESLRSPSATDSWHHRNGFQHASKAVEGYLHHPIHGQVARFSHFF
jgi:hypothetical protein